MFLKGYIHSNYYGCKANGFKVKALNLEISNVIGEHKEGHTNDDVLILNFKSQVIIFAPIYVGIFFPNLLSDGLSSTGLIYLKRQDLSDLKLLEGIDLSYNHIKELPGDVFDDLINLQKLDLQFNELVHLPEGILDNLVNLKWITIDYELQLRNEFILSTY